jgi:hypothetical protein
MDHNHNNSEVNNSQIKKSIINHADPNFKNGGIPKYKESNSNSDDSDESMENEETSSVNIDDMISDSSSDEMN